MSALVISSQEHKPAQANPGHAGNKPSEEPAIVKRTLAVREHPTLWIYRNSKSHSCADHITARGSTRYQTHLLV